MEFVRYVGQDLPHFAGFFVSLWLILYGLYCIVGAVRDGDDA